jgi:hypothetical protein
MEDGVGEEQLWLFFSFENMVELAFDPTGIS